MSKKKPKTHWNYRVLLHQYNNENTFIIHEVYYTNNKPDSYTETGITTLGESISEIRQQLELMTKCLEKPILYAGEKFPAEYNG